MYTFNLYYFIDNLWKYIRFIIDDVYPQNM